MALCQSWNAFVVSFNNDAKAYRERITAARQRFETFSRRHMIDRLHSEAVPVGIRATEFDISHGTSTRSELSRRFCMQDSELSGMLLKLSRGRDQVARHAKRELHEPQLESSDRPSYRSNRGNSRQVTRRQVPTAVAQAAPRLNGKQLCLRYISAKGCPSKVSDRCTYEFLGHFTPDTLAPIVQEYVVEKYGGLSSEMSSHV
ncbi:hypothetical protein F441_00148 [Phytophthora nicotianae CJ01A1]|uniref:Uncharacterized protein n=2 Tax=Phytophthora nicotianae TaxID=4792 RepID=W2XZI8_PHYNI|nr:hypothetical protein L916_00138 [Phytophthora nicotianae]ETP27354.1 hypothetical protein F441_00148 [Phytophthora nicotianae CJ01A1]